MKRQWKETGPCETQILKLAGKSLKMAIITIVKDINIYAKVNK